MHSERNQFAEVQRPQHSRAGLARRMLGLGIAALVAGSAQAQFGLSLPSPGANQKASVSQWIGLVEVNITYNSPDVTGPNGQDRTGQIWGQLVPYGLTDLGFGDRRPSPWRAGANENTVFTVSHDVLVEGEPLAAGRYGLHFIVGEDEWEAIFSRNADSWGSFFYNPAEDALRVSIKPQESSFHEWLTYGFEDRQATHAVATMAWEKLKVGFKIEVPNINELYLAKISDQLRSSSGFSWQGYNAAVQFCLNNNIGLEQALEWADRAISYPFIGQENFATLSTKARVLAALERNDEAESILSKAVQHATATPLQVHGLGRQLLAQGRTDKAMEIFQVNQERHGDAWPVHVGLARGHSALGDYKKALKHAKTALEQAPDENNKQSLEQMIQTLEQGEDVN